MKPLTRDRLHLRHSGSAGRALLLAGASLVGAAPSAGCARPCPPTVDGGVAMSDPRCAAPLEIPAPAEIGGGGGLRALAAWPAAADGRPTGGAHPVVLFAHASQKSGCRVFDRYQGLQRAWAATGAVVLSVGAGRRACGKMSARSLELRAGGLRAARAAVEAGAHGGGPLAALKGAVDLHQIWYAGHSRGGGAALLAAAADEAEGRPVAGVIALQPTPPRRWGLASPVRARTLILLAGADTDVTPALSRSLLDETVGPVDVVTLPGAVHAWTGDDLPLRPGDAPGVSEAQQRAWTTAITRASLQGDSAAPWEDNTGLPRMWARWPGQVALDVRGAQAGTPWDPPRPQDPVDAWWQLPTRGPGARLHGPRGPGGAVDLRVVGPIGAVLRANGGPAHTLGAGAAGAQGEMVSLPGDVDALLVDVPGVWVQAVAWRPR